MVHCAATIFSAILNKLWCHVTSETFFRQNINMLGDVTFPTIYAYIMKVLVVFEQNAFKIYTQISLKKIQAAKG